MRHALRHARKVAGIVGVVALGTILTSCPRPEYHGGLPFVELTVVDARCDTELYHRFVRALEEADSRVDGNLQQRREPRQLVSQADLDKTVVHDCQRLIIDGRLGPLVAILVSTENVQRNNFTEGIVVAEIVNYDDQPYDLLGIEPGLSCLWVRGDVVSDPHGREWIAAIRRPTERNSCVHEDFASEPPESEHLTINRVSHNETTLRADLRYPSTGRWMWDGANQFIGIRCGEAWCEFGRGFSGTDSLATAADVPGWYDEQLLSYTPPEGGPLVLSNILGRIEPAREFYAGSVDLTTDRHVATVTLRLTETVTAAADLGMAGSATTEPALEAYSRKLKVQGLDSPTEIHARREGPVWWQLRARGHTWVDADHNPHNPHAGHGAVRWAWSDKDEGVWIACDGGCCRSDQL